MAGEQQTGEAVAGPVESLVGTAAAPSVSSPPVSGGTVSARFDFHRKRVTTSGTFYVLGEIENTSPVAIRKPELVIIMLDDNGERVGVDGGFALKELLDPAEKSYISAVVTSPPQHADTTYEVVARPATYRPKMSSNLAVTLDAPQRSSAGLYRFSGGVQNGGGEAARFVNVRILAFDAADRLLSVHSTYAKPPTIAPSKNAHFSLLAAGLDEKPARFEAQVTGRPEPPATAQPARP
jgi:hypothetical protein